MKMISATLVLFAFLLSAACGSKVNSKIDELAAKPAGTTIAEAKALYNEVGALIDWVQNPSSPEKATPEELAKAKVLQVRRRDEGLALGWDAAKSGVSNTLGAIGIDVGSINAGKARDWFLGFDDPRFLKYACIDAEGGVLRKGEPGCPP